MAPDQPQDAPSGDADPTADPAPAVAVAEAASEPPEKPAVLQGLPRVVSLIVLLGVVLLIGVMFFRVMASFLVPLFLAAVLAVVFKPLHVWSLERFEGRQRLAALATTLIISLGVVVPTALLGWMAYVETSRIVRVALVNEELVAEEDADPVAVAPVPPAGEAAEQLGEEQPGWTDYLWGRVEPLAEWYQANVNDEFDPARIAEYAARNAVRFGLVGVQAVVGFLLGLAIMIFALYYFLADGPAIVEALMHLSPLDDDYERELLVQFSNVSRAVVLATILSAIVQGLLAGVGYYFTLDSWTPPAVAQQYADAAEIPEREKIQPPLFLLTVLTMLLAIVPFVGATAVWIPVALWLFFVQGSTVAGIGMAIYGAGVVSSIDNFIKPYVLHGQSKLHPLLALLSVLGGIQLLGPIGILVGPMLVAFLQALLEMLRRELDVLRAEADPAAT